MRCRLLFYAAAAQMARKPVLKIQGDRSAILR
jgi:hypothetical protein